MKNRNSSCNEGATQKIKCKVETCKYQDDTSSCCSLPEIEISCDCGCCDALEKDVTVCQNFECDCDKIEKNEE